MVHLFSLAFNEVVKLANKHAEHKEIVSMTVVLLTDGEDSSVPADQRGALVDSFKTSLLNVWKKPLTVHTVACSCCLALLVA